MKISYKKILLFLVISYLFVYITCSYYYMRSNTEKVLPIREYELLSIDQVELVQYALGQGRKCVNTLPYGAVADNKLFDFDIKCERKEEELYVEVNIAFDKYDKAKNDNLIIALDSKDFILLDMPVVDIDGEHGKIMNDKIVHSGYLYKVSSTSLNSIKIQFACRDTGQGELTMLLGYIKRKPFIRLPIRVMFNDNPVNPSIVKFNLIKKTI